MNVSYGSVNLRVNSIEQDVRVVYSPDGADYLYTHIITRVTSVWHPYATSDANNVAIPSIASLRATLMTPRLPLVISVESSGQTGSYTLLRSPLKDNNNNLLACDAKNGPLPIGEPYIKPIGETAAIVQWAVETWVVECSTTVRPILSHRWEMEREIDTNLFTTRIIRGEAYFNTSWMQHQNPVANPDDFTTYLFHPLQRGFKRDPVRVKQDSDGAKISYIIVDREVAGSIAGDNYPNITQAYGFYHRYTGKASGSAQIENAGMILFGGIPGAAVGTYRWFTDGVSFPSAGLSMEVYIYGNPAATMADLANAMSDVLANFKFKGQQFLGQNVTQYLNDLSLTYSMGGGPDGKTKSLSAKTSGTFALGSIIFQDIAGVGPGDAFLDGDLTQLTPVTSADGDAVGGNPVHGAYGTTLLRLVSQTLQTPCANPGVAESAPATPLARTPN